MGTSGSTGWRQCHQLIPGIALGAAVTVLAHGIAAFAGAALLRLQGIPPEDKASPVSGIMVAIILGITAANTVGVHRVFIPGLQFGIKRVLRVGIILIGIRLSFFDVMKLGAWGIPVVVVLIAAALVLTHWLGRRLNVTDRLVTLAAASTAICGVTAAVAVGPAIDAEDEEVAYTIANVTIFGMVAMFLYPYLAHLLFSGEPGSAGLFLGTSIHDTSQVMGAALAYRDVFHDEAAMKVATVTKLTRNVCLVAVVPVLAYLHARRQGSPESASRVDLRRLFPTFVLGFLAMAILRSIGDAGLRSGAALGFLDAAGWAGVIKAVGDKGGPWLLGTAMACVGLTTRLSAFRGLGVRPLYLGALAAVLVGAISLGLAAIVGPRI